MGCCIFQVAHDQGIDTVGSSLRDIFVDRLGHQRYILEHTHEVEVAQGADGTALPDDTSMFLLGPGIIALHRQELIAVVDGCIIVSPQIVVEICLRHILRLVEAVDDLGVAGIVGARTTIALVAHILRRHLEGECRTLRHRPLPAIVAAVEENISLRSSLVKVTCRRIGL